jgi:hypothetical protein
MLLSALKRESGEFVRLEVFEGLEEPWAESDSHSSAAPILLAGVELAVYLLSVGGEVFIPTSCFFTVFVDRMGRRLCV